MPRNVNGVYSLPPNTDAVVGQIADPDAYNTVLSDLRLDANAARPIVVGGTGATNAADARTNLGLTIGTDIPSQDQLSTLSTDINTAIEELETGSTGLTTKIPFFASGAPLPTTDQGPIWHADYASMMSWQSFTTNGASYTGYASLDVGRPVFDGQSSARAGHVKLNGATASVTTYTAVFAWAQHNNIVVTSGWTGGVFKFLDNQDGTFRFPDIRGEFFRVFDDGRGVNPGRVFGSFEIDALQNHNHNTLHTESFSPWGYGNGVNNRFVRTGVADTSWAFTSNVNGARVANDTRPRNVALSAQIKF